jgi:hypothetical protein
MLETIKNIVAVIGPLVALFIAWRGLSTWNRQLSGTRDSELSKRILVALYNIEMMIEDIRSPFVEYPLPEGVTPFDQEANNRAWADHYEVKFRKLFGTLADLHAASIEAKAVWDKSFMECPTPLIRVANRLKMHWRENVRTQITPNYQPIFDYDETRSIIYGVADDERDAFGLEVKAAIEGIDERVRRHISSM